MARQMWQVWIVAAALAGVASAGPNVIVLLSDDMGYADLGCYGAKDIRTPNIDALATAGTRFTQGATGRLVRQCFRGIMGGVNSYGKHR